jgi:hypothetical protein
VTNCSISSVTKASSPPMLSASRSRTEASTGGRATSVSRAAAARTRLGVRAIAAISSWGRIGFAT